MMISFLMAFVTTALVVAEWFEDLRRMGTVPMVRTGSLQMLTYLVKDGDVGLILCFQPSLLRLKWQHFQCLETWES